MADGSAESVDQDGAEEGQPHPRGWAKVKQQLRIPSTDMMDRRWTLALDKMLLQQLADASSKQITESAVSNADQSQQNIHSAPRWNTRITEVAVAMVQNRDFELIIIFMICLNCFVLALYTPLDPGSVWNVVMNRTDAILNVAFTVEAITRVLALGSLRRYIASPWNAFDAFIVSMGYLSYIDLGKQATGVRALRGLRALRPLRTMRAFKPLRIVVDCFFAAAPLMSSVIALIFFFIFITGLVGMQIFAESYHHRCVSVDTGNPEFLSSSEAAAWGCGAGRSCPLGFECMYHADPPFYEYRVAGFDNVGAAMLTAFQISTIAGWSSIFYRTWDSTGVWCLAYHLSIIVFVAYILVNCFLAGLKLKFASASHDAFSQEATEQAQGKDNSLVLIFKALLAFYKTRQSEQSRAQEVSKSRLQQAFAAVADHPWFTRLFMVLILVNTVAMAMEHDGMSETLQDQLTKLNTYLTYAFAFEVAVKMIGQGLRGFFSEGFNVFDFFVVILAFVELIMVSRSGGGGSISALRSFKTLRILKSFRVLRMLRMFRYVDSLRALGEVMMDSMESFLSVSFLCFLFLMVFAIIGLHTMGDIAMDAPNFNTFYAAFLTVFQILTLENWEEIMFATIQTSGMLSVFVFFVVWVLIGKFVLLSLFLAVILEAFEVAHERQVKEKLQQQETLLLKIPQTDSQSKLSMLQPIPTFRQALSSFASRFRMSSVHPRVCEGAAADTLTDTSTDTRPATSTEEPNSTHVTVPFFSQSQMEAAKNAQRDSLVAYSMQISGLRVPAQELAELASRLSTARSGSGEVRASTVVGILQSASGPILLSVDSATQNACDGLHEHGSLPADRTLSLTAVPLGESQTSEARVHANFLPSPRSSLDSSVSQAEENIYSAQLASGATGWADGNTTVARMVYFHAGAEHLPTIGGPTERGIPLIKIPSPSATLMDDDESATAALGPTGSSPRAPDLETHVEKLEDLNGSSDLHADKLAMHRIAEPVEPCATVHNAKPQPGISRSVSDMTAEPLGAMQNLQQAAKHRQRRRLDSLRRVTVPSHLQPSADRGSVTCGVSPQISADPNTIWRVADLVAQPVLDREHDWLMNDPDALSSALKKNPIFSIIAQDQYYGSDSGSETMSSSLSPDEFLISEFITASTCFGPSSKDKEDEDPVKERVFGLLSSHLIRAAAIKIVLHWTFDYTMTAAIVISCGAMTLERPSLSPESQLFRTLATLNLVLNALFGMELILKLLTYGFQTYWSRTSNKIDALIVLLSVLLMAFEDSGLSIFRSLRSLRAIKVLRVATRSDVSCLYGVPQHCMLFMYQA